MSEALEAMHADVYRVHSQESHNPPDDQGRAPLLQRASGRPKTCRAKTSAIQRSGVALAALSLLFSVTTAQVGK